jgi:hypothetical protein
MGRKHSASGLCFAQTPYGKDASLRVAFQPLSRLFSVVEKKTSHGFP